LLRRQSGHQWAPYTVISASGMAILLSNI